MILKNTDTFTVTVKNCQTDNGESDVITETGTGTLRIKDGRYYVKYTVDTATVMIKLDGQTATVTRMGEARSDMEYKLNHTTRFLYNTPYGAMEMELYTKGLSYFLTETGGRILLQYDLNGMDNNMEITLKRG